LSTDHKTATQINQNETFIECEVVIHHRHWDDQNPLLRCWRVMKLKHKCSFQSRAQLQTIHVPAILKRQNNAPKAEALVAMAERARTVETRIVTVQISLINSTEADPS